MKHLLLIAIFSPFIISSCAIYRDNPIDTKFTGSVKYKNGKPASNASVVVTSSRDYFPLLLMLVPHQPPVFRTTTHTDRDGRYTITAPVSLSPTISADIPNPNTEIHQPLFTGMTRDVENAHITLDAWDDYMKTRKEKRENKVQ